MGRNNNNNNSEQKKDNSRSVSSLALKINPLLLAASRRLRTERGGEITQNSKNKNNETKRQISVEIPITTTIVIITTTAKKITKKNEDMEYYNAGEQSWRTNK